VTCCWKAFDESCNFALDLIPIEAEHEVIAPQSCKSSNLGSFGTPFWESWDKKPFGCGFHGAVQNILYGGSWWLPRIWAVGSLVMPRLPMACPNTKGAPTLY